MNEEMMLLFHCIYIYFCMYIRTHKLMCEYTHRLDRYLFFSKHKEKS